MCTYICIFVCISIIICICTHVSIHFEQQSATGELQDKAVVVIRRVMDKLNGLDYTEGDVTSLNKMKLFDIRGNAYIHSYT